METSYGTSGKLGGYMGVSPQLTGHCPRTQELATLGGRSSLQAFLLFAHSTKSDVTSRPPPQSRGVKGDVRGAQGTCRQIGMGAPSAPLSSGDLLTCGIREFDLCGLHRLWDYRGNSQGDLGYCEGFKKWWEVPASPEDKCPIHISGRIDFGASSPGLGLIRATSNPHNQALRE